MWTRGITGFAMLYSRQHDDACFLYGFGPLEEDVVSQRKDKAYVSGPSK